jgi:hypothetical protein
MSRTLQFPDFFIVGAPRCGTTAMCRYLSRHPQICFSRPKEPHYFSRLDHDPTPEELRRDYLNKRFGHFEDRHRAAGEGSVSYLYLPGVIERINNLNPEAKFVVQIRNPLSMLPSYHQRMRFLLQEDEPDFRKAWDLQEARHDGRHVPKRCLDWRLLMYSHVAMFGVQVERLFNLVGRDRSHVIVFDDFKADNRGTYLSLLDFLGVEDDGQTDFERRFQSQMYRYEWLQKLLYVPATRGGKAVETLQQKSRKYNEDGTRKPSVIKRLAKLNKIPVAPSPLSEEMADVIREILRPDLEHLSSLLGRDMSFWLDQN